MPQDPQQDPYASIAQPIGNATDADPYAAIAKPATAAPPQSGGWAGVVRGAKNLAAMPGQIYDAITKGPETDEEKDIQQNGLRSAPGLIPGHLALPVWRLIGKPMSQADEKADQYEQAAAAEKDPDVKKQLLDAAGAWRMGARVPMVGPIAAQLAERAAYGEQGPTQKGQGGTAGWRNANADPNGALAEGGTYVAAPAATEYMLKAGIGAVKPAVSRTVLLGKTPEEAYQSALKPSTTINPAKVSRMVQTGLENKIPVSAAGAEKLNYLLEDLQDKVAQEIGSGQGKTIDPQAVAQRADQVKGRFANQVNPTADLEAIENSKQEFLANNPNPIPAADAQAMKQGTYAQLKGKAYGELKSASIEAQKALARGLNEEIMSQFPELKGLNAEQSKLFDLEPVLEKAVQRQANHQLGGISSPIVAAGTKAVTGSNVLAGGAAILKAVVDNPVVKSRLAIALSHGGNIPPAVAFSRVESYLGSLAGAASASKNATQGDQNNSPQQ